MGKSKKDPWKIYQNYEIVENTKKETDNCPVVLFVTHLFLCNCNTNKSEWESSLKNAKNGEDCYGCRRTSVMPYKKIIGKTPYQGPDRKYGVFRCHKCSRMWESAYSWANTSQKCEVCLIDIFPYDQDNLQFKGLKNQNKGHQTKFCSMCDEINGNCSTIRSNPSVNAPGSRNNRSRRRNRTLKKKDNEKLVVSAPDATKNSTTGSVLIPTNNDEQKTAGKNKRRNRQRGRRHKSSGNAASDQVVGSDNAIIKAIENLEIR